jgi:hypothetical protein
MLRPVPVRGPASDGVEFYEPFGWSNRPGARPHPLHSVKYRFLCVTDSRLRGRITPSRPDRTGGRGMSFAVDRLRDRDR